MAFGGNKGGFSGLGQCFQYLLVGSVPLVGNDRVGGCLGQQDIRAVDVTGLSGGEVEAGWIAQGILGGMD